MVIASFVVLLDIEMFYNFTQGCRSCLFINDSYLNDSGMKATEQHLEQPYRTTLASDPFNADDRI